MAIYYVRPKESRRYGQAWAMIEAESPESAKNKFVREHNAYIKMSYGRRSPKSYEKKLVTPDMVSVRNTPPTRGDIYRHTMCSITEEYVPRPRATRSRTRGGRKTLADKQFDLLVKESQRIRKPISYSNDLYEINRSTLRKHRPRAFIWVVSEAPDLSGTHLYPLDKKGKPLSDRELKILATSIRYHAESPGHMIYLVQGTSIRPLSPAAAMDLVNDVIRASQRK